VGDHSLVEASTREAAESCIAWRRRAPAACAIGAAAENFPPIAVSIRRDCVHGGAMDANAIVTYATWALVSVCMVGALVAYLVS
jgi:hypothetical protein